MYVISSSEAHSTRRLWRTRNIRKITALMGKMPVAAIVKETYFGPYHFGARGWVRDIRYNRTRWPPPMKLTMRNWWRETRLENETTHFEETVFVAHLDPSLVSKRAVSRDFPIFATFLHNYRVFLQFHVGLKKKQTSGFVVFRNKSTKNPFGHTLVSAWTSK